MSKRGRSEGEIRTIVKQACNHSGIWPEMQTVTGIDFNSKDQYWAKIADDELVSIHKRDYKKLPFERAIGDICSLQPLTAIWLFKEPVDAIDYRVLVNPFSHYIAVEGYVGHFDMQGKMAAVYWSLQAEIADSGHHALDIPPKLWKKMVIGNGNASKEDVKEWAIQMYSLPGEFTFDAYDAVAIAHAANYLVYSNGELTNTPSEDLKVVLNGKDDNR